MNSSNQRSVVIVCAVLGFGLLYLAYTLFWVPLQEYGEEIARLEKANNEKSLQILQILRDRKKLQQWRVLSLPGVESLPKVKGPSNPLLDRENALLLAQSRYIDYLRELLTRHGIKTDEIPRRRQASAKNIPQVAGTVPVYTPLQFSVDARGKLDNLVKMLEEFQSTPLLHRIRNVTIKQVPVASGKATPSEPLALSMVVEALIVNGAQKRGERLFSIAQAPAALDAALIALHRRPTGLGLMPWHKIYAAAVAPKRTYADIARKNVFEGAPPPRPTRDTYAETKPKKVEPRETPDLLSTAYLTDVTIATSINSTSARATVFDRLNERALKLRLLPGWNSIPLLKCGEGNTVVRGQVVRISTRGIVFRVELFTRSPDEEPTKLRFKKKDAIYSLDKASVAELVKAKVIRESEAARTFKVPAGYWQDMIDDRVVRAGRGPEFAFRNEIVRGRVLKRAGDFVVIRLDEKYCSFREDEESERVRPHAGYCLLSVGERLTAALQTPLSEAEVRELLHVVAQRP